MSTQANLISKSRDILTKYWGYDTFRPVQEDLIQKVLEDPKVLGILPTGAGKSICYQIPTLALGIKTIVISPLISLIQDQCAGLKKRGIEAINLSGFLSYADLNRLLGNFRSGPAPFLFCSPERLKSKIFQDFLPYLPYEMLVIDEAHCVSDWGDFFRPSYKTILDSLQLNPPKKILALTASAPPAIKKDIKSFLHMEKATEVVGSIRRPNIQLQILEVETPEIASSENLKNEGSIVYAHFRKKSEQFARYLCQEGFKAKAYHGGLPSQQRSTVLEQWLNNEINTVVATSAFGMGIDKPDVRTVHHINPPASLEHYYQEAGRAGRDGKKSKATFYFNEEMLEQNSARFQASWPNPDLIKQVYEKTCSLHGIAFESDNLLLQGFKWDQLLEHFENKGALRKSIEVLEKYDFLDFQAFKTAKIQWLVEEIPPTIFNHLSEFAQSYFRENNGFELGQIDPEPRNWTNADFKLLQNREIMERVTIGAPLISFPQQRPRNFFSFFDKKRYMASIQKGASKKSWLHYFLHSKQCLWRILEIYFGEKPGKDCGECSNCQKGYTQYWDTDDEWIQQKLNSIEDLTLFEPLIRYSSDR
ncbi:MAG: ATP-dependent DNA helicase RecQ [Luteibaculaceae bacterium]